MSSQLGLFLISTAALSSWLVFLFLTKKLYFHTPNTDNELMAYAASQSHRWKWPSDVHRYSNGKTFMKDVTIILLSLAQKISRDKTSDSPYTRMTGLAISMTAVLIYLIAAGYFSPLIGLLMGLFYLSSFWPWQVSLYGGHANMGNVFMLAAIFAIQLPFPIATDLIISGALACLSLFSTPSSNKLLILLFGAILYSRRPNYLISSSVNHLLDIYLPLSGIGILLLLFVSYKYLVKLIYNKSSSKFLNKIMLGRDKFPLEFYFEVALKKIKKTGWRLFYGIAMILILINFIGFRILSFWLIGFVIVLLALTLPNIKSNLKNYFDYFFIPKRKTHFAVWIDHYAKRGIKLTRNMRGGGLPWVPKIYFRFSPFHLSAFLAALVFLFLKNNSSSMWLNYVYAIIIAIGPIIWAELTGAPQASRLYSPGLISLIFLPGYALYQSGLNPTYLLLTGGLIILISLLWSIKRFFKDVYPQRLAVKNIILEAQKRDIKEIYTYETNFNYCFIDAIPGIAISDYMGKANFTPPFIVHRIASIKDVKNGWIAIPPTSHKGATMGSDGEAPNGDYDKDPLLNKLIETRDIEKIATVKIPTYSTSDIWVHEDDITSWRDLILEEYYSEDRWRGSGWILHTGDLAKLPVNKYPELFPQWSKTD